MVLHESAIPLHPDLEEALAEVGEVPLDVALGGGEDYELCFTVPPGSLGQLRVPFLETFGIPLTRVGSVVERAGAEVLVKTRRGTMRSPRLRGFSHFTEKGRE